MHLWFFTCAASMFMAMFLHFRSVEHIELQKKHGLERGSKLGYIYGSISGTAEFIFLIGLWFSPQPKFSIPIFPALSFSIAGFSVHLIHLVISLPLISVGAWVAVRGVKATGLEASETHRTPEEILTTGVYSLVRHPQYFGWVLSHIGMSVLLSAWYSMIFTPVLVVEVYLISKKEEDELIKEFGEEYREYQKKVPMLIPRFRRQCRNVA